VLTFEIVWNQGVPYQQLARMLEDATVSIDSMRVILVWILLLLLLPFFLQSKLWSRDMIWSRALQ
jgi:hypothetical protein